MNASSPYDTYTSPLATRNASEEMLKLWSARHKFNTWRRIWLAVAEAQHEMGLPVSKEQVEELRAVVSRGITDEEIRNAEKHERELRHDVMAHVHALGDSCPKAKGIIHLGMTSQDVVCNADVMILTESLIRVQTKTAALVVALGEQAGRARAIASLGFTHYQAAQPVSIGRRFAQYAYECNLCFGRIFSTRAGMLLKGFRGATGTQAAILKLFEGEFPVEVLRRAIARRDVSKGEINRVDEFELLTIEFLEWDDDRPSFAHDITTQTYPRVVDTFILADLASTAAVLHKIATDIRLLCNRKELDEPFEDKQIGSSAMPYKRNPMRCERICGLARFVMNLVGNAYDTAATQWLERTLDDSSNRRLSLPEAFLALDGALDLMHNVASGLIVHEAMVKKNLMAELPFMATENIMMECVKLGGDRQHYHELIRQHAQAAGLRVKQEGLDNDLLDRLKNDKNFWSTKRGGPLSAELNWDGVMDPMKYVGRSVEQTERFIKEVVEPLREQYKDAIATLGKSGPRV
ncbi:MAG: adenylosuccinate lyase [Phycisphaerales bacterium]|nr:adenylosuccinate lyase [Phycisphaerales bacterium]